MVAEDITNAVYISTSTHLVLLCFWKWRDLTKIAVWVGKCHVNGPMLETSTITPASWGTQWCNRMNRDCFLSWHSSSRYKTQRASPLVMNESAVMWKGGNEVESTHSLLCPKKENIFFLVSPFIWYGSCSIRAHVPYRQTDLYEKSAFLTWGYASSSENMTQN